MGNRFGHVGTAFLVGFMAIAGIIGGLVGAAPPEAPGIGMSGSFYTLEGLAIPVGGEINSSDVFIVVYSYYNKPLKVVLNSSAPPGISIGFSPGERSFVLEPNSSRRINVIININNSVVPGTYKITIYATAYKNVTGGPIKLLSSVAQDVNITVTGQYSIINAAATDPSGRIVTNALIRLERMFQGTRISVADSYGTLHAKVVPGNYTVLVYLAGDLVGEKNISVAPYETANITIPVRIVFIEYFDIEPILDNNHRLVAARVYLNVKNVYKTIQNASITLQVKYNGEPLEERPLLASGTLPLGRSQYRFDYVPPQGWKPGNYSFVAKVYGYNGKLLAISEERWLNYSLVPQPGQATKASQGLIRIRFILPLALLALIAVYLATRRRKRKKRKPTAKSMR